MPSEELHEMFKQFIAINPLFSKKIACTFNTQLPGMSSHGTIYFVLFFSSFCKCLNKAILMWIVVLCVDQKHPSYCCCSCCCFRCYFSFILVVVFLLVAALFLAVLLFIDFCCLCFYYCCCWRGVWCFCMVDCCLFFQRCYCMVVVGFQWCWCCFLLLSFLLMFTMPTVLVLVRVPVAALINLRVSTCTGRSNIVL